MFFLSRRSGKRRLNFPLDGLRVIYQHCLSPARSLFSAWPALARHCCAGKAQLEYVAGVCESKKNHSSPHRWRSGRLPPLWGKYSALSDAGRMLQVDFYGLLCCLAATKCRFFERKKLYSWVFFIINYHFIIKLYFFSVPKVNKNNAKCALQSLTHPSHSYLVRGTFGLVALQKEILTSIIKILWDILSRRVETHEEWKERVTFTTHCFRARKCTLYSRSHSLRLGGHQIISSTSSSSAHWTNWTKVTR